MFRQACTISLLVVGFLVLGVTARAQSTVKAGLRQPSSTAGAESDRVKDGLVGPVRRVRTEIVKLTNQGGRVTEGKRSLMEIAAYDLKGRKVENQYFPVEGATLTGKEVYKYDEKGNISEMTLLNDDGTLLSREIYKYEFDFAGNWNKMTTSVAVVDSGRLTFEPTEVTIRSIMYYLDENMVKMVQPAASQPPAGTTPVKSISEPAPVPPSQQKKALAQKTSPSLPDTQTSDSASMIGTADPRTLELNSNPSELRVVMDTEPPPSPSPKPILKPVSGGVLNGRAISLPAPAYPDNARRMRVSGVVSVEVVVDETGKVIAAQATGGPASLRDAALQAALRARFSPTKLSGQPVKVTGSINYKFSLAQ